MLHRYQYTIPSSSWVSITDYNPVTPVFIRYLRDPRTAAYTIMHTGKKQPHASCFPNSIRGNPRFFIPDEPPNFDTLIQQYTFLSNLKIKDTTGIPRLRKKQRDVARRLERLLLDLDDLAVPPDDDIFLKMDRKYSPNGMEIH